MEPLFPGAVNFGAGLNGTENSLPFMFLEISKCFGWERRWLKSFGDVGEIRDTLEKKRDKVKRK